MIALLMDEEAGILEDDLLMKHLASQIGKFRRCWNIMDFQIIMQR